MFLSCLLLTKDTVMINDRGKDVKQSDIHRPLVYFHTYTAANYHRQAIGCFHT